MRKIKNKIKVVIWDLDGTLWSGTLAECDQIILYEKRIQIIYELNYRGIVNTVCSKNSYEKARSVLEDNKIWDLFVFSKIDFLPKGKMVKDILDRMNLRAQNALFIDDNEINLREVEFYNPDINIISANECEEILESDFLKGKKDAELTKLQQYRHLEKKDTAEAKSDSNIEFLRQSRIKIEILDFSEDNFERIMELIEKTNQLNFTKNRMTEKEMKNILRDKSCETKLCRVVDCFGDYGIVGFYSMKKGHLIHFVFSCRIMNMGIEQFIYAKLNYPHLEIQGEVATKLTTDVVPDWITFIEKKDKQKNVNDVSNIRKIIEEQVKIHVFAIGACDLIHAISYLSSPGLELRYECNVFKGRERSINVGTEYIRSMFDMTKEQKKFCNEHFYNYTGEDVFSSQILEQHYDFIIMSFHDDMVYKIYTNSEEPNLRVVRSPAAIFGLTSIIEENVLLPHDKATDWLRDHGFDNGKFISGERFKENLLWIASHVSNSTKFLLITGPEIDYFRDTLPKCPEVRHQIKLLNRIIRELAITVPERFLLIDINQIVVQKADYTDYVFHLTAESNWRLYKLLANTIAKCRDFQKPSILANIRKGRKLILIGNGIEKENAILQLAMGGEKIVEFIDNVYGENWKNILGKFENNEYYCVIADEEHSEEIGNCLKDLNWSSGIDYMIMQASVQSSMKGTDFWSDVIEAELHKITNPKLLENTWEKCLEDIQDKKVFIWGIGRAIPLLKERMDLNIINGLLDKDPCMLGVGLDALVYDYSLKKHTLKVLHPSVLKNMETSDVAVIIGSLAHAEEISKELDIMNINHYYSLLVMEAMRRKSMQEAQNV